MFTIEQRDGLRERVLRLAEEDERVLAGAVVGSLAIDDGDRFSDVDLTFGIAEHVRPASLGVRGLSTCENVYGGWRRAWEPRRQAAHPIPTAKARIDNHNIAPPLSRSFSQCRWDIPERIEP